MVSIILSKQKLQIYKNLTEAKLKKSSVYLWHNSFFTQFIRCSVCFLLFIRTKIKYRRKWCNKKLYWGHMWRSGIGGVIYYDALVTTSDRPTLDVFWVSPPVPDTSEALFPCVYKNSIQIYSCISKTKCTNMLVYKAKICPYTSKAWLIPSWKTKYYKKVRLS